MSWLNKEKPTTGYGDRTTGYGDRTTGYDKPTYPHYDDNKQNNELNAALDAALNVVRESYNKRENVDTQLNNQRVINKQLFVNDEELARALNHTHCDVIHVDAKTNRVKDELTAIISDERTNRKAADEKEASERREAVEKEASERREGDAKEASARVAAVDQEASDRREADKEEASIRIKADLMLAKIFDNKEKEQKKYDGHQDEELDELEDITSDALARISNLELFLEIIAQMCAEIVTQRENKRRAEKAKQDAKKAEQDAKKAKQDAEKANQEATDAANKRLDELFTKLSQYKLNKSTKQQPHKHKRPVSTTSNSAVDAIKSISITSCIKNSKD